MCHIMRSLLVSIIIFEHVLDILSESEQAIVWELQTPVYLRGNASIHCMIHESDTPGHMAWTKSGQLIGINSASLNATKYDVFVEYSRSSMMYYLVIKNIGIEDLNLVYKCESGFSSAEGILPLNEDTFLAPPKKEDIARNFTLHEGILKVFIELTSVYPIPRCNVSFKDIDITRHSETNYTKELIFYSMKFVLVYQTNECGNINVSCGIGKRDLKILQIAHEFKDCEQLTTAQPKNNGKMHGGKLAGIISGVVVVLAMPVICIVGFSLRRQKRLLRCSKIVEVLPEAINRLTMDDRNEFIKLMEISETERRYFARVMIVGKNSVGKTCLSKRLLMENINDVTSTDGVDIVERRCKISLDDGSWNIEKDVFDDKADRIHRAIIQREIMQNRLSKSDESAVFDSEIGPSKPMVDKNNAYATKAGSIGLLDKVHTSSNYVGYTTINNQVTITDNKANLKENEDQNRLSSLVMPVDLTSSLVSTTPTSNGSFNLYASCGLWDFAGRKEFYATHQAFLTSSAIYLVVADIADDISKQNVQQYFADYQNVGEYVEFWFDSIHCLQTVKTQVNQPYQDYMNPPVIMVFTGKDKYEKVNIENRKKELQTQLDLVFKNTRKYHHLREVFYLSNVTDNDNEFEKLQLEISAAAMKMDTWGECVPLKWILLEHLIEINRNNGKNFITFSDMVKLAKHRDIGIQDINEVVLFLRFQHQSGNVIFFENILDLIILNPQWLVDAFRCLVSDKIDANLHHRSDWITFVRNGLISKSLITELFKSKRGGQFLEQREHLLHVMETFDILVKIDNTDSYIMPSMMPSVSFDEICKQTGVKEPNCNRTSWLCLQFDFIPPAFFNHVFVYLLRKYTPSKMRNTLQSLALFRGICIFDIDSSACTKLMVAMSSDTIALQLLSFSKEREDFGLICSNIRQDLMKTTDAMKKRYKLNIFYELRFKCSAGHYYKDTISYKELTRLTEYYCKQHNEVHQSIATYLPWMTHTNEM